MNKASPPATASSHPSALQECLDEALLDGPRLIQQWLQTMASALLQRQKASTPKEMPIWRQAHETLQMARAAIQSIWVRRWHESMRHAVQHAGAPHGAQTASLRFEALELMNQEQVHAAVEAARFEQRVLLRTTSAFESWLSRLNHIAPQTDHQTLTTSPLRPEISVQALLHTLEKVCPDDHIRLCWLQTGSAAWAALLTSLYELLDRVLDHHGPLLTEDFQTLPPASQHHQPSAPVDTEITLSELHQLLVSDWSKQSAAPSTLALALGDQSTDTPQQAWQETTIGEAPAEEPADRRRKSRERTATDTGTAPLTDLAEEVVGLMLDSMTNDPRLLAPVIEVLQQLRPALLQAAREEPRFFSDRNNPARQLLDEFTLHSLAYTKTSSSDFQAFLQQLTNTLSVLNSAKDLSASARFTQALRMFLGSIASMKKAASTQEQSTMVASLLKAEQRYLLTEQVRQHIAMRTDIKTTTPELLAFLYGPWAQVIAETRLSAQTGHAADKAAEDRCIKLISDLIWSCNPVVASRDIARLVKTIPLLLRQLKDGLQRIHFSTEETHRLLLHVMGQHDKAMKNPSGSQTSLPTASAAYRPAAEVPQNDWQSTIPLVHLDHEFAPTEFNAASSYRTETPHRGTLPALTLGAWVEMNHPPGHLQRAELIWISPHGTMYLFKNGEGQSTSLSKSMCEHLFQQQRLRVIAMNSMVDDALDTVMAKAVRNSAIWP